MKFFLPALFVICVSCALAFAQQPVNLGTVITERLDLAPGMLNGLQAHAINNQGTVLASYASAFYPEKREVVVIQQATSAQPKVIALGAYPCAQPVAINEQGHVVVNMCLAGPNQTMAYLLPYTPQGYAQKNGAWLFQPLGTNAQQAFTATAMHNGRVALNTYLVNQDTTLPAQGAAYYKQEVGPGFVPFTSSQRGFIVNTAAQGGARQGDAQQGGNRQGWPRQEVGFPIALLYNLDSKIFGLAAGGTYCGTSKGYLGKRFLETSCPFYATQDSVYLVLDGLAGQATALNDSAVVVGTWLSPRSQQPQGFIWSMAWQKQAAAGRRAAGWQELARGRGVQPAAINNRGVVVGFEQPSATAPQQAFVWQNNQYQLLAKLLAQAQNAGWTFTALTAINNSNYAVGHGTFQDQPTAFIIALPMAPTP